MSSKTAFIKLAQPTEEFPYCFSTGKQNTIDSAIAKKGEAIFVTEISLEEIKKRAGERLILKGKMANITIPEREFEIVICQKYDTLTLTQLKNLWKVNGLKGHSTKTKEELIAGLMAEYTPTSAKLSTSTKEVKMDVEKPKSKKTKEAELDIIQPLAMDVENIHLDDYSKMTLVQLKALWKTKGLKGYSNKSKEDLIAGLNSQ